MTKVSDRYVIQKFKKEFERVVSYVYTPMQVGSQEQTSSTQDEEQKSSVASMKDAFTTPLNYLRFKEFLIEMCFLTEAQATADTAENTLAFELWEIIAPKVDKPLDALLSGDEENLEEAEKLD